MKYQKVNLESYQRISKYQDMNKIQAILLKLRTKIARKIREFVHSNKSRKYSFHSAMSDVIKENKMSADFIDCYSLYEDVLERQPECILELGPGASTIAICLAILEVKSFNPSYNPKFISVESRSKWLEYHKSKMPENLLGLVDMRLSGEEVFEFEGKKVARYTSLPKDKYDFVYVDGPDLHGLGVYLQTDIIDLAPFLSEECYIIFDGRRRSVKFQSSYLNSFKFRRHYRSLNYILFRGKISSGFLFDYFLPRH